MTTIARLLMTERAMSADDVIGGGYGFSASPLSQSSDFNPLAAAAASGYAKRL